MFRVKICGITEPEDAHLACQAGADAVGLNFYPRSSRFVELAQAQKIAAEIPAGVLTVGVFVNESPEEIIRRWEDVPLGAVQLHGDEPPEFLLQLKDLRVIKAFRCSEQGIAPLVEFLEKCQSLGCLPEALLIDAAAPGQYGGSGQTLDWNLIPEVRSQLHGLPVILAGGLKPDNVRQAIETARPDGVDVASGVEAEPGRKDVALVKSFVESALSTLRIS